MPHADIGQTNIRPPQALRAARTALVQAPLELPQSRRRAWRSERLELQTRSESATNTPTTTSAALVLIASASGPLHRAGQFDADASAPVMSTPTPSARPT